MEEKRKQLAFAITEYLNDAIERNYVGEENKDSLEVAIQCISEAFGIDPKDDTQKDIYSIKPTNLLSIFDVYLRTTQAKANVKPNTEKEPSEEDKKNADEKKKEGNAKMAERKYDEAIKLYTEAIELNGKNAIYYANRAAAFSQSNQHEKAIEDALKAVESKYLIYYLYNCHAQYCLGKYDEAVKSYEKVLELDPNNASITQSLELAKSKATGGSTRSSDAGSSSAGAGGMPNLGNLDFASLMNNPAIMNMAQEMMKNPEALNNLMNNPALANL
ncbi:TPR-like protein [Neocallimastix californiae]|uniref:TPR-like protein n=1 Tax=Neocallimastix californiae TaxID=1754190 RepID=A0A1Y2CT17_9FUNG|nr:TPR-like protein [Neocallimastix californiae]|eukprot:ORY50169.1 TPR-like protein [Neocallimastix californiae]